MPDHTRIAVTRDVPNYLEQAIAEIEQSPRGILFLMTLEAGVPFRILDIAARGGPTDTDWDWAREFAWTLGERGDIVLYRGAKRGQTAEMMAALIEVVALCAFLPGGICIAGRRFVWENGG